MNRLVIIGNGFDLAHGLPTSYRDFIDDYWANLNYHLNNSLIILHDDLNYDKKKVKNFDTFLNEIKNSILVKSEDEEVHVVGGRVFVYNSKLRKKEDYFKFKNTFFENINKKALNNWVDIENEYYESLKEIVKSNQPPYSESKEVCKRNLLILNNEFEEIKNLFENYLEEIIAKQYDFKTIRSEEIINNLKQNFLSVDFTFNKEEKEFYSNDKNKKINSNQLLSFNYTDTIEDYANLMGFGYNYIHGKLKTPELPIIFGFGDEMDDSYTVIENFNDNEYLKNFKSIKYLEHSTYKHLYNYIESEPFQVFIMGHSCGLSDRTLLSTIFENENCLSVKVFYYQYLDKNSGKIKDNYTEIVQNISRHFKDKKMLRKKVVEKRHCQPLIKYREIN